MRNFCCGLVLMLATGIFFSCGSKTKEKKFFDVPGYFEKEIEYIKANYSTVSKTSVYNGTTQVKEFNVSEINWNKEFGIFLECDINKPIYYANGDGRFAPAWHGPQDKFRTYYIYISKSKKLGIQLVNIEHKENGERVTVEISKSNLISITDIKASYEKNVCYQISGEQRIKGLGDKNIFFIKGEFK